MHVPDRLYKAFNEENALQRFLCRKMFAAFQRLGVHVTGNHFYELVPDTRRVSAAYRDEPRALLGIDLRFHEAEQTAVRLIRTFGDEFRQRAAAMGAGNASQFKGLDALFLYCCIRDLKPRRIVEVGQGTSTRVILAALARNGLETHSVSDFMSLDPYARFTAPVDLDGVRFSNVRQPLEAVDTEVVFGGVDFVFIDSSHVYKFGSDVELAFERLYPSLRAGVLVHVHDIFSPYHYPKDSIVQYKLFWNEQYYLENFLKFNSSFRVSLPVHYLYRQSQAMRDTCEDERYRPFFRLGGSSFYFEKVA